MSNEDLMKPRYKVIADYPGSDYKISDIIENIGDNYCKFLSTYPHLFKKLEWWEDLKPAEMPKYVKWEHGGIFEIMNWRTNVNTGQLDGVYVEGMHFIFIKDLLPATKEEYESQNKKV